MVIWFRCAPKKTNRDSILCIKYLSGLESSLEVLRSSLVRCMRLVVEKAEANNDFVGLSQTNSVSPLPPFPMPFNGSQPASQQVRRVCGWWPLNDNTGTGNGRIKPENIYRMRCNFDLITSEVFDCPFWPISLLHWGWWTFSGDQ